MWNNIQGQYCKHSEFIIGAIAILTSNHFSQKRTFAITEAITHKRKQLFERCKKLYFSLLSWCKLWENVKQRTC